MRPYLIIMNKYAKGAIIAVSVVGLVMAAGCSGDITGNKTDHAKCIGKTCQGNNNGLSLLFKKGKNAKGLGLLFKKGKNAQGLGLLFKKGKNAKGLGLLFKKGRNLKDKKNKEDKEEKDKKDKPLKLEKSTNKK